jgi:hypothetical protein
MPVISREQIADYTLLRSNHFFPDKYILTKGVTFGQNIETNVKGTPKLHGRGGINMMKTGLETTPYNGVLSLPILISTGTQVLRNNRIWVDGLDFILEILGNNCSAIDSETGKIFRYLNQDFNASAIQKISIVADSESDLMVNIDFLSNVENVFEFTSLHDDLLTTDINSYLLEMRTARTLDATIGFQTALKQLYYRLMTRSNLNFNFIIDKAPIWGSKRPREIFNYANYNIDGQFTIKDNLTQYQNNFVDDYHYNLYAPNFQQYGELSVESTYPLGIEAFMIDFGDIDYSSTLRFTTDNMNTSVSRSVDQGVLTEQVQFESYNRNI